MSVFSNIITLQGLEPLQFPTKFRSHSLSQFFQSVVKVTGGRCRETRMVVVMPLGHRMTCSFPL